MNASASTPMKLTKNAYRLQQNQGRETAEKQSSSMLKQISDRKCMPFNVAMNGSFTKHSATRKSRSSAKQEFKIENCVEGYSP